MASCVARLFLLLRRRARVCFDPRRPRAYGADRHLLTSAFQTRRPPILLHAPLLLCCRLQILTLMFNILSTTLLLVGGSIPPAATNWAVAACSALGALLLMCYTERRTRSAMDEAATGNSERLLKSVLASATQRGSCAVGGGVGLASVAALEGYDAEGHPSTPPRSNGSFRAEWTPDMRSGDGESPADGAFAYEATSDSDVEVWEAASPVR